jgi:hypothetical protein
MYINDTYKNITTIWTRLVQDKKKAAKLFLKVKFGIELKVFLSGSPNSINLQWFIEKVNV